MVSVFACTDSSRIVENANTEIINMNFDNESVNCPFYVSQYIDSINYIAIKSDKAIGDISDMKFVNGCYYLHDQTASTVHVIDSLGYYKRSVGEKGRASNEYITLNKFTVNPINGEIHILDVASRKFLVYNRDGDFLRVVRLKHYLIADFEVLDNGDYLCYTPVKYASDEKRGLWTLDAEGNFKKQLVSIDDDFRYGGVHQKYFKRIDKKTIGLMGGEDYDRVYYITADTVIVPYKLSFSITLSDELKREEIIEYNNYSGSAYMKWDYQENERWMTLKATDFEKVILLLIDKTKGDIYQIKQEKDYISDRDDIYGNIMSGYGNTFIGLLDAQTILNVPTLKNKFQETTINSNPMIVVHYTK